MPKVSVVIPCYNVEKYISECLDSVLSQSFKDLEIICIEDCSTDKTRDILKTYAKKHKNIRLFYNNPNKGQSISRNIGIDNSKGEYIFFLDSDDTISSDCIKELYNQIKYYNCDMVMGQIKVYTKDKHNSYEKRSISLQNYVNFNHFTKLQITNKISDEYYSKLNCCPVNKLYKKDFLKDNNIHFINKKIFHEDDGFWLKILACNPLISSIQKQTYFYRIRNSSTVDKMSLDKKAHISNLKESLTDAFIFVKNKNKTLERFIYYEIYKQSKHRLFYFVWTKFEKRLKLLSYPIFGLKLNDDKYKLKILGIPVFKWKKRYK